MSDDASRNELEKVQLQAALQRLSEANNRITQLEREERLFRSNGGDAANNQLAELARDLAGANDGHNLFPAYVLSRLWQHANIAERHQVWSRTCNALGITGLLAALAPHDDNADPLTIMVRGSGGYGDMLYLSAIVRGLYYHFDRPRIFVVHEHSGVPLIFSGNPYVVEAQHLAGEQGHRFLQLAAATDVFDLIADVRYAVTYAAPPRSRVQGDFLAEANGRSLPWQNFVRRDWPYLNNIFAKEIVGRGFSKYSFSMHTANVASQLGNFGDFMQVQAPDAEVAALLAEPYVTIHHGADRNMASADGLQTKNLPLAKWLDIVARVNASGLRTVQLGEAHEQLVAGVDGDLRGKCSMAQSAMVLRHAQAHIDTEGGLVHLARAVGTPSVVAFGPTSLPFFGYPENTNVAAQTCGDCWWTSRDWSVRCPRDLPTVICMESHASDKLAAAAIALSQPVVSLSFVSRREAAEGVGATAIGQLLPASGQGAIVSTNIALLAELADHGIARDDVRRFAIGESFHQASARVQVYPATWARVPLDSGTLDWIVCALDDLAGPLGSADLASLLFDCARTIQRGQIILTLKLTSAAIRSIDLAQALQATLGGRMEVSLTGAPDLLNTGVYALSVERAKRSFNGGKLHQATTKVKRGIGAMASTMVGQRRGANTGGSHD